MPRGVYERTPERLEGIRKANAKRKKAGDPCSIEGCTGPLVKKGMCNFHYLRQYNGRDLTAEKKIADYGDASCTLEECDRPAKGGAHGYCHMHYHRVLRHGDPHTVKSGPGQASPVWKGDDIGYQAAHERVRVLRPDESACIHCGGDEHLDWALNHETATDPRYGDNGHGFILAYSLNPDDYIRLCRACHRAFDREWQ